MKKKLMSLVCAAAMMLSLAACGSSTSNAPAASEPSAPAAASYTVGIVQLVPHVALDAATQGFKDALEAALPGQVKFEEGSLRLLSRQYHRIRCRRWSGRQRQQYAQLLVRCRNHG